ncbi:MAG: hemolysin family protein [Dehalococcoidia bacterium]|jgi:putative hemolysin
MTGHEILYLALFGACILLSAFFSSSETALFSLQKVRLKSMVDNQVKASKMVAELVDQPAKLLSTILLCNNLVNVAAAAIATTLAIKYLPEDQGVLVATACTTVVLLIFSETVPKTLATQHSEKLSLTYARPLKMISWLLSPLVMILSGIASFFSRLIGGSSVRNTFFSVNEIRTMISAGQQEGEVKESEAELLHYVFDFFNLTVREVMVPRPDIDAIERGSTIADLRSLFIRSPRSRFPVFKESMDNVVGILVTKEVFQAQAMGTVSELSPIDELVRPALFTPETKPIHELLNEMRGTNNHMAIVVDEYGGTAGIVSLTGLAEEIVGETGDELSPLKEEYQKIDENTLLIDGRMRIDEANRELGLELPENADYETVAGLVLSILGHIPKVKEQVQYENIRLTVTKMRGLGIIEIRVNKEENIASKD